MSEKAKMAKPTPEQIKAYMEMQKKAQEVQKAFLIDIAPLNKQSMKLLKAMKKCKECKESKYKFVPCDKHYEEMKALGEAIQKTKFFYGLKQQLAQIK